MMKKLIALLLILVCTLGLFACEELGEFAGGLIDDILGSSDAPISLDEIPEWNGLDAYIPINGNVPFFTEDEITTEAYELYADLDGLKRCGVVMACIGTETMPPKGDERGDIKSVKPSGWIQAKYDTSLVSGGYLYNRCHLIGWQLTDEDANEKNLITGTKYLNIEGMLPFENMIADYIKETDNHVMYRVTPIFKGNNLLANGVLMEAYSVEDEGEGIQFCIYAYNVQPGIIIDYTSGESEEE